MRRANKVVIKVFIASILFFRLASPQAWAQAYSYDALGRVTQVVTKNGATTIYHYDNAGNRTQVVVTGASAPSVSDASFESPGLGANGYQYNPSASGVTFAGASGVAANGSAWGFPASPDGNQVAFLQNTASISQSISGLKPGKAYAIVFQASHRPNYGANPVTVAVNGNNLMTISPTDGFGMYTTPVFTASSSNMTVVFSTSANSGDCGSGIDAITIQAR